MPLRLRASHAFGTAHVDLDERPGGRPHVVGRGRDVEVVVPSLRVRPRHCAFLYDAGSKRWLLQAGLTGGPFDTAGQTTLNGVPLDGPRQAYALQVGDVVTLGDDPNPPTLTVEEVEDAAASAEPEVVELQPPVAPPRPIRRRRRRAVPAAAFLVVGLAGAVIGGGAVAAWSMWPERDLEVAVAPPVPTPEPVLVEPRPPVPEESPEAEIELPADVDLLPPEPEPAPPAADAAGVSDPVAGLPADDPRRGRDVWRAVVAARDSAELPAKLAAYGEYLDLPDHLTGPLAGEVRGWLDAELDALWWRRIAELLEAESELTRRAVELEKRLRQLPPDPAALRDDLAGVRRELSTTQFMLGETMAYGPGDVPRLEDAAHLDRLRQDRAERAYAVWSREVLRSTAEENRLPWDG